MSLTILSLSASIWILLIVLCLIFGLIIGLVAGYFIRVKMHEKSFTRTKNEAEKIIAMAEGEAEKKKKEALTEAKQEIANMKADADRDIKERRSAVVDLENKLNQREETLDRRSIN
ncbi:MAG: Rnase Y domain-containing protein, partial [Anaeroplasmataceae bacterium]|nr:Rnase Y domain-containing protein [Anaeroplasmataceae bacterium]